MRCLMLVALLLASSPAWAEWVLVAKLDSGAIYVDPSTIKKNGDYRRVWMIINRESADEGGARSYKDLVEYDCKDERSRWLQNDSFSGPMGQGNRTGGLGRVTDWRYVAPDTSEKIVLTYVCAR